ncbi:hypothetical protein LCM00_24450, partial [Bacillus infantis]|uniref:hypothetical protein n=1 Tax=Bacillus infantis TaxID=324767 RepID=UPI001CD7BF5E
PPAFVLSQDQTLHIRVRFSSDKNKINVDVFVRSVFKEQSFYPAALKRLYYLIMCHLFCQHFSKIIFGMLFKSVSHRVFTEQLAATDINIPSKKQKVNTF